MRQRYSSQLKFFSSLSVLFIASVAFAQATTKAASSGVDWHSVLTYAIQAALAIFLTTIVPTLLIPLLPKIPAYTQAALDWLTHQASGVKNAYAQGVLNRLITLAGQKVLALENTEVAYIREQFSTGTVTADQLPALLAGVKQRAIDAVKADATAQGLWQAAIEVFLGNGGALSQWLGDVVESHVAQLPTSNLAAPKVAPSTQVASTTSMVKGAVTLASPTTPVLAPAVPPPAALR